MLIVEKYFAEDQFRIMRNSITLTLAKIISKFLSTGLIIYVARVVGETEFGLFSALLAYMSLFSILQEFGLTTPTIRNLAKGDGDPGRILGRVITAKLPLGLAAVSLLICGAFVFHYPMRLAVVFGVSMFFENQAISITRSFEGFERMNIVARITLFERTLLSVLGILALSLGGGLLWLGFAYIVTNISVAALGLFLFSKHFSRISLRCNPSELLPILRQALPFFVAGIFSVLYNRIDIYVLDATGTSTSVGIYNAAFRIVDAQMFIPVAVVSAMFPVLTRYYPTDMDSFYETYGRGFYFLVILGTLIAIMTGVFSDPLIRVLYGSRYHDAAPVLTRLSFMFPFYFASFLVGTGLIAAGKENLSATTLAAGAIVNGALCVGMIPSLGPQGAAYARVGAEIFSCGFQMLLLHYVLKTNKMYRFPYSTSPGRRGHGDSQTSTTRQL